MLVVLIVTVKFRAPPALVDGKPATVVVVGAWVMVIGTVGDVLAV